jgi:hypothetical protein
MIDLDEYRRFLSLLLAQGIRPAVIPLGSDRHPLVEWREWPAGAYVDPREWPTAEALGFLTGSRSGGVVVIDIDHKGGVDGFRTFADLELRHGTIPATLTVRSPGGSLHLYLLAPGARFKTQAGQLGPGVDVRGEGGLVIAPGSWHSKRSGHYVIESSAT